MEQFQSRVQQNVNLADDELSRLANYLITIRGDVAEARDGLNRVTHTTSRLQHESAGRSKRIQAEHEAFVSRINAKHHSRMHELQEHQAREIETLHRNFEDSINNVSEMAKTYTLKKTQAVDELISRAEMQQKRFMESAEMQMTEVEEAPEDIKEVQAMEMERQRRLEQTIEARTQERLTSLRQAKTRLSDCVASLEEMERNHAGAMTNCKNRLDAMDKRYNDQVARETHRHEKETMTLKRKQSDLEERAAAMQRTIRKIERHHKSQIEEAVREGEMLKTSVEANEARSIQIEKGSSKVHDWTAKLQQLRSKLESTENGLIQARTDNESMKREIARLKHEARMQQRRMAIEQQIA